MCINTELFNDFFHKYNRNKNFIDFLRYTNKQYINTFEDNNNNMVLDYGIDIATETDIDIICNGITFKKTVKFQNCNFKGKASFKNCIFEYGVYFNNSMFSNYVDFHECKFYKDACFYGVTFNEVPNFSACQFKEPRAVNLINVDVSSLDFRKVESFIDNNFNDEHYKKEIEQDSTNQPIIEQKYRLKYAKNIKDSFRTMKDILITQNNILEAQEWHKLELYAKEKEIEINLEKTHKSDKKQPLNRPKEINLVSLTIDKTILWLYRNTSFHHTNFTKILNFSLCMVATYSFMLWVFHLLILDWDKKINLFSIKGAVLIILCVAICYTGYKIKKINTAIENMLFFLLLMFILIGLATFLWVNMYLNISFFAIFYLFSIIITIWLYLTMVAQKSMLSVLFHFLMYSWILGTLIIKPQLINPFMSIFSSDRLFESKLETKLNTLSPNLIIKLSKISQKEFTEQTNHKTTNNDSFIGVNEAKKIIVANRAELSDIVSFVFNDKKIEYFRQILLTLENSPSALAEIIKNIDDSNNNFAILYAMSKLLDLNFTSDAKIISYILNKEFLSLFINIHSDEEYKIFESKDNQAKLKNILSLINLDSKLHLQEIKQAIDYDIIMSGTTKSTSVIYSIILLLCIFSLQKTARKNSIIPS